MTELPPALAAALEAHGQGHALAGFDALPPAEGAAFAAQLGAIDLAELAALYRQSHAPPAPAARQSVAPVPVEDGTAWPPEAVARGEAALRAGEVAALVVAGGQGSRLNFDRPKGLYPVGPVSGATLFQLHAEKVLGLSRRYGKAMPLLVMTSPATHAETVAYFAEHRGFGLAPGQLRFFQQGTMPALDLNTGRLLLEAPGRLALSPNGHGGSLTALADSGQLAELEAAGVRTLFYFQVDNPLVAMADPGFVGRHLAAGSEASTKVVFKAEPGEKVGVLALVGGRCAILEYSDLPPGLAGEREPDGTLRYRAGNTAIHAFDLAFLRRITRKGGGGAGRLGYHVARKKVPYFDPERGELVKPAAENAVKFELFVFDALPLAERTLVASVDRDDEFAPLKNATGADSPETVRAAIADQGRRWLIAAGVAVPEGVPVEVGPLVARSAAECAAWAGSQSPTVSGPTYFTDTPRA